MTAPMIGCSVALSKISNFTFRCAATGRASISSKPMSITFLIVFIYIVILFFPNPYTISASLWLVSLPFIFYLQKERETCLGISLFPFIDISYSLLFDSVLLFIRSQVCLILCLVFGKCGKTRLVYCLKETF